MKAPDWWEAVILALAGWRVFQLVAFDKLFEQPRRYVTRLGREADQDPKTGQWRNIPEEYRGKLGLFITCPYCAGFWIVALWWLAWLVWPDGTLFFAVPLALSAGVIAGHKLLGSE